MMVDWEVGSDRSVGCVFAVVAVVNKISTRSPAEAVVVSQRHCSDSSKR